LEDGPGIGTLGKSKFEWGAGSQAPASYQTSTSYTCNLNALAD